MLTIGARYRFDYPEQFVTLKDYTEHRGQVVTLVRPLSNDEFDFEGDQMYRIRADDGWEGDAWESELEPTVTTTT